MESICISYHNSRNKQLQNNSILSFNDPEEEIINNECTHMLFYGALTSLII